MHFPHSSVVLCTHDFSLASLHLHSLNRNRCSVNRRYPSALAQDECIPFWFGMQAGRQVSARDADAVLRVVSAAVNGLWAVNPPALLSIVLALASCVKALSLRPRVFAPLFTALISSSNLMELHTLVVLEAYFPNTTMLTAQEPNSMWHRLLANLNHGALRREHTALHLAWLRQWLSRTVIASEADAIELCASPLPRIFDDPDIMQRKIGMVYVRQQPRLRNPHACVSVALLCTHSRRGGCSTPCQQRI